MAICPSCGRDKFNKRTYTNYHTPQQVKIFWACTSCGLTEEGYWQSAAEYHEAQRRAAEGTEETESDGG